MNVFIRRFILILIGLIFINYAKALTQVLKIENARNLNAKEWEFFPETIPIGCHPLMVDVYVNDEMINQIKLETNMTHNDFFKKDIFGNKIKYTYFPKECRTKHILYSGSSFLKIKNEIDQWIIFNKKK